jgi:aconitate hydratase
VQPVRQLAGTPVQQVCIGSCTNSSVMDLETVAAVLRGKTVAPGVSLTISPGSKQALTMIARSGALADLVAAGARILEAGCGPCIGMGQAPASGAATLRSFNRNFSGRSGTDDAGIYLASAEVCAASALAGMLADPRDLGAAPAIALPQCYVIDDNMIVPPATSTGARFLPETEHLAPVEVVRGPNIVPLPTRGPLDDPLEGELLLVVGDNITTDHIMPAGAEVLPLRSNIPAMSAHVFARVDPTFPQRARQAGKGLILGGENYGQGSSREHAALVPMYLGVQAVIAVSFARIHQANLVNFGILPLTLAHKEDYAQFAQGDRLRIANVAEALLQGAPLTVHNVTRGVDVTVRYDLSPRQVQMILAGGLLNMIKGAVK